MLDRANATVPNASSLPIGCDPLSFDDLVSSDPAATFREPTSRSVGSTAGFAAPSASGTTSDPLGTTNGLDNVLFPLDPSGQPDIIVTDINQGTVLGDCYFLAALGELAVQHPAGLQDLVSQNVDGTETVTLYDAAGGGPIGWSTTSFAPVAVTVNNADFISGGVNGLPGEGVENDEQVIWPQVFENAFAQLTGGYASIENGGYPVLAMETLTGRPAVAYDPSSIPASLLGSDWSAGDLVVFDTPDYDNPSDTDAATSLIGDHAYIFDGLTTVNGVVSVDLLNPWGDDEPGAVPVSSLHTYFDEVDVGQYAPPPPPSIAGAVPSVAISDQATSMPFSRVAVTSDGVDTVTVALSAAANGRITDARGGTYSSSTGVYTFSGTAVAATAALDALVFTPTAHQVAAGATENTTLTVSVSDVNGLATASTSILVTGTAASGTGGSTTVIPAPTLVVTLVDGVPVSAPSDQQIGAAISLGGGAASFSIGAGTGIADPSGDAEALAHLYGAVLGRAPDLGGLEAWTRLVDGGDLSLATAASDFVASPEFASNDGSLTDTGFVQVLAANTGNFASDQTYVAELTSGVTPGAVALQFAESATNVGAGLGTSGDTNYGEVYRLYETTLGRAPDAGGLASYMGALQGGASVASIVQDFIGSQEYLDDFGTMSNTQFVTELYQNGLGRSPDAGGLQTWVNALGAGLSRASVALAVSDSSEGRMHTTAATHDNWVYVAS